MPITQAVPLLRVADVARSIEWYRGTLGFVGDPFPGAPPHEFAILRHGQVELMLRRGSPPVRPTPRPYDWDVYLRREGSASARCSRHSALVASLHEGWSGCLMVWQSLRLQTPMVMSFVSASRWKMRVICQHLTPNALLAYSVRLVAQICNLPYRRFVIGMASESSSALALSDAPQNAILRYSATRRSRSRGARRLRRFDPRSSTGCEKRGGLEKFKR